MTAKMAKRLSFAIYDTMTTTPFMGNPTPVFILSDLSPSLPESNMQLIAREMNHTETVFVRHRSNSSPNTFDIRFYTPLAEEPLCGHGILGATHALYAAGKGRKFDFMTFEGLKASASIVPSLTPTPSSNSNHSPQNNQPVIISMSFPSSPILPSLVLSSDLKIEFAAALGIHENKILAIGQNELRDIVIEVDAALDFSAKNMEIDPVKLLNASPEGTRSQVITSAWSKDCGVDFAKRVFAYGSEDQATGSTYCALVPYWGAKLGKAEMTCLQPSWRSGGARLKWVDEGKTVEILAESVRTVEGSVVAPLLDEGQVRAKL